MKDFLDNYRLHIIITTIVLILCFVIYKFIQINIELEKQPIVTVIGVVTNKTYIPERQRIYTTYNSSTKRNEVHTVYDPEEYITNITLLDNDDVITRHDKRTFIRYNEKDSLSIGIKRWKKFHKIKSIEKYNKSLHNNNEF